MHWIASLLVALLYASQCQCTPKSCCDESCECCVISKPDSAPVVESHTPIISSNLDFNTEFSSDFYFVPAGKDPFIRQTSYYLLGKNPTGPPAQIT